MSFSNAENIDFLKSEEIEIIENVGAGKGNLSTVSLIRSDKFDRLIILKIPIVEQPKVLASPIKIERFQKMHNSEVDAYKIINNHPKKNIQIPKIYEAEKMDIFSMPIKKGFIKMEFIENCHHVFLFDNLSSEDLIEPLKNLARLHSLTNVLSDQEKSIIPTTLIKDWFSEIFCDENMKLFMNVWKEKISIFMKDQPDALNFVKHLPEILSEENLNYFNNFSKITGINDVICHGDVWPPNILFEKLENGSRKFKALCDFQTFNLGNAAQDICRLLITSMSGKERRANYKNLLKIYYDELTIECHPNRPPFTFNDVVESYDTFLILHGALLCAPTPAGILMRLAGINDEEQRAKIIQIMTEKYCCALEDMSKVWQKFKEAQASSQNIR